MVSETATTNTNRRLCIGTLERDILADTAALTEGYRARIGRGRSEWRIKKRAGTYDRPSLGLRVRRNRAHQTRPGLCPGPRLGRSRGPDTPRRSLAGAPCAPKPVMRSKRVQNSRF